MESTLTITLGDIFVVSNLWKRDTLEKTYIGNFYSLQTLLKGHCFVIMRQR